MLPTKFVFEKRPYNEDSTPEEIQAIKDNISIYNENIIFYDEIPIVSPFSIKISFDQIELLSKQLDRYGLLVDIRNTKRPDAMTRRAINGRFVKLCEDIEHVAFCTGSNFLINTAARFILHQTNLNSFSINKTIEEAIEKIEKSIHND